MTRPAILALCLVLCAGGAHAVDTAPVPQDALATARAEIAAARYDTAVPALLDIIAREPRNADALNLLGFSYRKLGQLDVARTWYEAALAADPAHLGALEYQGELFLMLGDVAAAQANLARLTTLCGTCEEHADLAAAIAAGS